jgi:drug/metabolite transporter (DMT)-like permease
MSLDRAGDFIWIAGALLLVGSALLARRHLPHGPKSRTALLWLGIFALLFGIAHVIDTRRQAGAPTGQHK